MIYLFIVCLFSLVTGDQELVLYNQKPIQIQLAANHTYKFSVNLATGYRTASHVVFQAHSQWQLLNVSFGVVTQSTAGQFAIGRNVGLVSVLRLNDPVNYSVVLIDDQLHDFVNVLFVAIIYDRYDPIPGACNLDLPLQNDPNVYLSSGQEQTQIHVAYGFLNAFGSQCGDSRQHQLEYVVYQKFLDERHRDEQNYMTALQFMFSPENVTRHARQIVTFTQGSLLSTKFAAYRGQGVIYTVVVRMKDSAGVVKREAAYVPVVTYSCYAPDGSCEDSNKLSATIILIIFGCCGLAMCFFGHRIIICEMFFVGLLAFMLTSFILLLRFSHVPITECLFIALGCGFAGGIIWCLLWIFLGSPILSVLLIGLEFGYLIASVLYIMTPLVLFDWLLVDDLYHLTFFSTVLFVNILILASQFFNILCCSVIGSYLVVITCDWFLQGGVGLVIINAIRKSAVPGYTAAYATMPFQLTDLALCILWVLLATIGVVFQLYRERNRPPFPACPWSQFQFRRSEASRREGNSSENPSETEPLLNNRQRRRQQPNAPRQTGTAGQVWQPGEHMWQPDIAQQAILQPPPYSSEPT